MDANQLAEIRERAEAIDLGEPASLISTLAADAHKDRAALLDHVDRLEAEVKRVEAQRRDCFEHADQWVTEADRLATRLAAVRELITEFETRDIMPIGQTTLLRNALEGDPPEPPHVPYLDTN